MIAVRQCSRNRIQYDRYRGIDVSLGEGRVLERKTFNEFSSGHAGIFSESGYQFRSTPLKIRSKRLAFFRL